MNKYINLIIAVAISICIFSCKDDMVPDLQNPDENTIEVPIVLIAANEQLPDGSEIPITRAPVTVEESAYKNIWVFQFSGEAEDAVLVGKPHYIDEATISAALATASKEVIMPLVESNGKTNRLVFVANTNNRNYHWDVVPGQHTYSDLKRKYINLAHTGEYPTYGGSYENLIMTGTALSPVSTGIRIDGDGSGVVLTRSLVNIELNLKVQAAGYKVLSVQLKNISTRLDLFHKELEMPDSKIYPHALDLQTIDYEKEYNASGLITFGNEKKFTWYVPRNTRGTTNESSASKQKRAHAITGSTYIEITALDNLGNGIKYQIYPGANNYNDYNIIPNHKYITNLTITGDGGATPDDSRIDQIRDVTFNGSNNSFILNPPMPGMPVRRFHIPVTRVNEYWSPTLDGYGGVNGDLLEDNVTEWDVELLWQDEQGMVRPIATADPDKNITLTKTSGIGGKDYFSITVPSGTPHGNFSIALRRKGNSRIEWSWHFWVTDYNPEPKKVTIEGHKWVYPVDGGELYRFGGPYWGYNSTGATATNNWNDYDYVGIVSPSAPYAKSFVMDRTVGAKSRDDRYGLTYQWGRKDPFPANIPLYDINGDLHPNWDGTTANAVAKPAGPYIVQQSVNEPLRFYKVNGDWSELSDVVSVWNDKDLLYSAAEQSNLDSGTGRFGKSIFDPCPAGWKLPIQVGSSVNSSTWSDFYVGKTCFNLERGLAKDLNQLSYWPYLKEGDSYPVNGKITFALNVNRAATTAVAAIEKSTYKNYFTTSDPSNSKFILRQNSTLQIINYSKATAHTVRCISE